MENTSQALCNIGRRRHRSQPRCRAELYEDRLRMSPWIGVGIESGFTFSSLILVKVMLTDCQISQLLQPFDSLLQQLVPPYRRSLYIPFSLIRHPQIQPCLSALRPMTTSPTWPTSQRTPTSTTRSTPTSTATGSPTQPATAKPTSRP
ncbi:hypothetical protein MPH_08506 [Macrophomina phaseolina MS6]|uniref:Uncharacterized protein n=1 Tax=Macrophomina phaseolina (strain MS6) TaxID=1126212 RepID=K2QWU1_MACPH|nr:hypothetical protein MPH_08506 [Macrophomina phaseolina MS6]